MKHRDRAVGSSKAASRRPWGTRALTSLPTADPTADGRQLLVGQDDASGPGRPTVGSEDRGAYRVTPATAGPQTGRSVTRTPRHRSVHAAERPTVDSYEAVSLAREVDHGDEVPALVRGVDHGDEVAALARGVDQVIALVRGLDLDALADDGVKETLRVLQRGLDSMRGLQCQALGTLEARALAAAGPGRERRAVDPVRRFGRDELQLSPSEAKKLGETGRRLREAPQAQRSMERGELRPELASVITDILRHLDGDTRDAVEERLVEAARTLDAVRLGQLGRQLLAEADQEAAMYAERRRHARRSGKVALTPDGMTAVHAQLSGLDGELAHTAIEAFRRPDAPGEHRTPEQATADALVEIFDAALRSRKAPTQHGERPHITITVASDDLENRTGVGVGMFTGPLPATEVLRLARDAKLTWVVVDPDGVPENVSQGRNVVRSAIWRALVVRDGGCRWPGCDAPPSRCDVAHAEVPDRDGGPRVLSNVALLCRRHHRTVDLGHWTMRIRGPDVIFDPPDGSDHRQRISTRRAAA